MAAWMWWADWEARLSLASLVEFRRSGKHHEGDRLWRFFDSFGELAQYFPFWHAKSYTLGLHYTRWYGVQ